MKYLMFLMLPLFLTACTDNYRYPCQDPSNWDKQECKKPFCSANGTCPEDLSHYEKEKAQQVSSKGECK